MLSIGLNLWRKVVKLLEKAIVLFCAAALSGFFFHLGQKEVTGAPFPFCPITSCRVVTAWYTGPGNVWSVSTSSSDYTQYTDTAILSIYAPTELGKSPLVPNGTLQKWHWDTSTPTCDKILGSYPFPQEVTPNLPATFYGGDNRNKCSPLPNP